MSDTPQDVTPGQDEPLARESELADASPSVRRLLRQYDVDITKIRGTGPNGRIRPGDVLAIVSNPQLTRFATAEKNDPITDSDNSDETVAPASISEPARSATVSMHTSGTTVFICNMSRVLAHRKRAGLSDVSVACYVAKAAGLASGSLPQLRSADGALPLRVSLTNAEGDLCAVLATPANESIESIHRALTNPTEAIAPSVRAQLSLLHHGLPGSLADFPPLTRPEEAGTLSLGGLHRTIGIGASENGETPRVVIQCQLALTYRSAMITSSEAARFVSECVSILETWPQPAPDPDQPTPGSAG